MAGIGIKRKKTKHPTTNRGHEKKKKSDDSVANSTDVVCSEGRENGASSTFTGKTGAPKRRGVVKGRRQIRSNTESARGTERRDIRSALSDTTNSPSKNKRHSSSGHKAPSGLASMMKSMQSAFCGQPVTPMYVGDSMAGVTRTLFENDKLQFSV